MRYLLLLLLISCAAQGPTVGQDTTFNPLSLYSGVGDVSIDLVKDKDEMYVHDILYDTIKVENGMPYDIMDLRISLYGIDQKYWSFDPVIEEIGLIEGRTEDTGWIGGRELITFELSNIDMPNMYNSKVYEYGYAFDFQSNTVFADADVCVGAVDYFVNDATTLSAACTVDTSLSYGGQGSLVNVGTVNLDVKAHTAGELQISGTLKNSGGGSVLLVSNLKGKIGTEDLSCYFKDKNRIATNIWDPKTHTDLKFECDPILFNSQPFYTNIGFEYEYIYRLVKNSQAKVIR